MNVHCIFCDTKAILRNNNVLMNCMCDDDFRTATIDNIKFGFHSDRVYLLTCAERITTDYEKKHYPDESKVYDVIK